VKITAADEIEARPVHWWWSDRAAVGTLALIGGREGIGKSLFAYTLAADLTRGRLRGVFYGVPKTVIVAAAEDSWAHVIVPRLMAAQADLSRVLRIEVETAEGYEAEISLPTDLPAVKDLLITNNAGLLLLDPLISRLDGGLDTHKDAEVRHALEPLVKMIQETEAAALGLIHVNKTSSTDPLNLLMGSRAFAAVARAVLFMMLDPEDERSRLVGEPKNNYGRTDLPTLAFTIQQALVAQTDEGPVYTGQLIWTGESDKDVRQILTDGENGEVVTEVNECAAWLEDYLRDEGGGAASNQIKQAARAAGGYTLSTLNRARNRRKIRVVSVGFPRQTFWWLPTVVPTPGRLETTGTTETTETTVAKGRLKPIDRLGEHLESFESFQSLQSFRVSPRLIPLQAEIDHQAAEDGSDELSQDEWPDGEPVEDGAQWWAEQPGGAPDDEIKAAI